MCMSTCSVVQEVFTQKLSPTEFWYLSHALNGQPSHAANTLRIHVHVYTVIETCSGFGVSQMIMLIYSSPAIIRKLTELSLSRNT